MAQYLHLHKQIPLMLNSFLSKLVQSILIITMVYAGSFVYLEESAEKNEKTEKFEEAIHNGHRSENLKRADATQRRDPNQFRLETAQKLELPTLRQDALNDFNVNYDYTTSYLDSTI